MSALRYLLKIDVSPFGEASASRTLGNAFVKKFADVHPDVEIRVRDLNSSPLSHLDAEVLAAAYLPEAARSPAQVAKHQLRLDLIKELTEAENVVVTVPLWNWSVPSVFKAYIDHIILIGTLDPRTNRKLAGKKVTVLVGSGGSYGPGSEHPEWDFVTPYLKHIFTVLGSEDVQVIRAEFTAAGRVPGMEALVPKKEQSLVEGIAAAEARAAL